MGKFVKPDPGISTRAHEQAAKLAAKLPKVPAGGARPGKVFGHTTQN